MAGSATVMRAHFLNALKTGQQIKIIISGIENVIDLIDVQELSGVLKLTTPTGSTIFAKLDALTAIMVAPRNAEC